MLEDDGLLLSQLLFNYSILYAKRSNYASVKRKTKEKKYNYRTTAVRSQSSKTKRGAACLAWPWGHAWTPPDDPRSITAVPGRRAQSVIAWPRHVLRVIADSQEQGLMEDCMDYIVQ
jgi:hypothetical protein